MISFIVWTLLLLLIANCFIGTTGGLLIGIMIAWHTAVIFDAGRVRTYAVSSFSRIGIILLILFVVFSLYFFIQAGIRKRIDFMTSVMDIEALDLKKGDTILLKKGRFPVAGLSRGDIVSIKSISLRENEIIGARVYGPAAGQVLGLPGDDIHISSEGVQVNAALIEPNRLPKGALSLPEGSITFTVPDNHIYCICPFDYSDERIVSLIWKDIFVINILDVGGKAIGIYLPWSRRCLFNRT